MCLGNPTITPKRILRSQWFNDPWTCGSYSHPRVGCSAQDLENMMEPLPTKGSQSEVVTCSYSDKIVYAPSHAYIYQGLIVLSSWVCFSPCRCCLLERPLIHATSLPSMEHFSLGGEKLIDLSHTTPSQNFKGTILLWQNEIYQVLSKICNFLNYDLESI